MLLLDNMTERVNRAHYLETVVYLSLFVIIYQVHSKLIGIVNNNSELFFEVEKCILSSYTPDKSNWN